MMNTAFRREDRHFCQYTSAADNQGQRPAEAGARDSHPGTQRHHAAEAGDHGAPRAHRSSLRQDRRSEHGAASRGQAIRLQHRVAGMRRPDREPPLAARSRSARPQGEAEPREPRSLDAAIKAPRSSSSTACAETAPSLARSLARRPSRRTPSPRLPSTSSSTRHLSNWPRQKSAPIYRSQGPEPLAGLRPRLQPTGDAAAAAWLASRRHPHHHRHMRDEPCSRVHTRQFENLSPANQRPEEEMLRVVSHSLRQQAEAAHAEPEPESKPAAAKAESTLRRRRPP